MEDNTKQTSEAISDDVRRALEILPVPMAVYTYEGGQLDGASSAARRIVKGILDCAADLGIDTLAEGVETREQAAFLSEAGCELLQGYCCGKPAPFEMEEKRAHAG